MADQNLELALRIRADLKNAVKQLDQMTDELDKTDKSARKAGKGLRNMSVDAGKLKGVLASIGAALVVREIIKAADAYSTMHAQLKLVSGSQEAANATFRDAYQLAQETRQDLGSTVELYGKLTRSTKELNLTDQERLAITRAINQSYVVSGAGAQEAAASTLQLSQGLAAGALRGEELNSVLENSPRLAQAIADGLGITLGALRDYGSEGKLTAEAVSRALLRSADDINSEFQEMPRTVGQAMQQLRNDLVVTFGQTDVSGFTDAIDDLRALVTDPGFQESVVALGTGIATLARWLGEATAEGIKFTKWAGEELARRYGEVSGDDIVGLEQQADELRGRLEGGLWSAGNRLRIFGKDGLIEYYSEEETEAELAKIEALINDFYRRQEESFKKPGKPADVATPDVPVDDSPIIPTGPDKDAEKRLEQQRKFVEKLEEEAELFDATAAASRDYEIAQQGLTGKLLARAQAANKTLTELERLKQAEEDAAELADIESQLLDAQGKGAEARGKELEAKFADLVERLEARGDEAGQALVKKLIDTEKLKAGLDDFEAQLKAVTDATASQRDLLSARYEAGLISQPQYRDGLEALDSNTVEQLQGLRDAAVEYADAMGDPTILDNFDAMVLGYQRLNEETQKYLADGQQINEMLTDGLAGAITDVVDGTSSAGEAFRKFAADFLRQIAQMILKQMIFNAISGGSAGGGVGGAIAGAISSGFAEGGYTGPGGKYDPAGIVHAGEYVQPAHVMRQPGAMAVMEAFRREGMRSLSRFQGYAEGGLVAAPSVSDSPAQQVAAAAGATVQNDINLYAMQKPEDIAAMAWGREGQANFEVFLTQNGARVKQILGLS